MAEHQSTTLPAKCKVAIGYRSGKLLVTERLEQDGHSVWKCECDCGETKILPGKRLTGVNATKSCGCFAGGAGLKRRQCETHGLSATAEYQIWRQIKARTLNPNHEHYRYYGAKGRTMCIGLQDVNTFVDTLGARPSKRHSVDRILNDLGYLCGKCSQCIENGWPLNVRWATRRQQSNNMSSNVLIEYMGLELSIADWSRMTGLPRTCISARLNRGWSPKKILTHPMGKYSRHRPIIKDDKVKSSAVDMYNSGRALADVARVFGCSPNYLAQLVTESGSELRSHAEQMLLVSPLADTETRQCMINDYLAGQSMRALTEQYRTSQRMIRQILAEHGIQLRTLSEACKKRPRKPNRYDDPAVLRQAINDYREGMPLRQIRRKYGGKDHHLKDALIRCGVKIKSRGEQISTGRQKEMF